MNFRLRLFCLYSFTWVNIVPIPPPPHAPGLFVLLSKQDEITLGKLHSLPSNLLVEMQIPPLINFQHEWKTDRSGFMYLPKCLSISCIGRNVTSLRHFSSSLWRSLAIRYKHINCPSSVIVPSEMHLQQTNWLCQQLQLQPIMLSWFATTHFFTWGSRELLVLITSWTAPILTFLILSRSSGQSRGLPTPRRRSRNWATWTFSSHNI